MKERITKYGAPSGTRVLLSSTEYETEIFEATVVEWSESGKVKLRAQNGHEYWRSLPPYLVDILD